MTRLHSFLLAVVLLEATVAVPVATVAGTYAAWRLVLLIEALRVYYLGDA